MITEVNQVFQKVSPSKKQIDDSISLFDKKMSKEFEEAARAYEKRAHLMSNVVKPFQGSHDIKPESADSSFRSLKDLVMTEHEHQRYKLTHDISDVEVRKTFMLKIDDRLRIMGPPYDVEWTNGVIGYAKKNVGEFGITPMNGNAAAAVGEYISPAQDVIARFTAYVPISFSWLNWIINSGYASTNGGIGVLVYDLSNGSILADNRSVLWNNTRTSPGLSNQPETMTYLSYTSAGETYFAMRGGGLYLVWVWCWSSANFSGNVALSMSSIACKMPFMVVKPWLSI